MNKKICHVLERHEYTKNFTYLGEDENKQPIIETELIYTGKVTNIIYYDKLQALNNNRLPEWKSKITSSYSYEKGHTNNGVHKYDYQRNPITLIKQLNTKP